MISMISISTPRRYEIVHDMPNGDWRRKGRAGGYEYILVNGVVTHRRDVPTGATPGQLVRVCADRRRSPAVAAVGAVTEGA